MCLCLFSFFCLLLVRIFYFFYFFLPYRNMWYWDLCACTRWCHGVCVFVCGCVLLWFVLFEEFSYSRTTIQFLFLSVRLSAWPCNLDGKSCRMNSSRSRSTSNGCQPSINIGRSLPPSSSWSAFTSAVELVSEVARTSLRGFLPHKCLNRVPLNAVVSITILPLISEYSLELG